VLPAQKQILKLHLLIIASTLILDFVFLEHSTTF
jgi:hypothetical protein